MSLERAMHLIIDEAETSALGDNNEEVFEAVELVKTSSLINNVIIWMEERKEEQRESNEND